MGVKKVHLICLKIYKKENLVCLVSTYTTCQSNFSIQFRNFCPAICEDVTRIIHLNWTIVVFSFRVYVPRNLCLACRHFESDEWAVVNVILLSRQLYHAKTFFLT